MEDLIIYGVGTLAVRGARHAFFGPSREARLAAQVSGLVGTRRHIHSAPRRSVCCGRPGRIISTFRPSLCIPCAGAPAKHPGG